MGKYGIPFYEVDKLTGDFYAMEVNSMTLILEKATLMPPALPWVSAAAGTGPSDLSEAFRPPFGTVTRWTSQVAKST